MPKPKPELKLESYKELPLGGVIPATPDRPRKKTGDWRDQKPTYREAICVNCLLCWVRCPEVAIITEGGRMRGFNYDYCKGCGICAHTCPSGAIEMVPEEEEVPPFGRVEAEAEEVRAGAGAKAEAETEAEAEAGTETKEERGGDGGQ